MIYYAKLGQKFYIAAVWLIIPVLNFLKYYGHRSTYDYSWLAILLIMWSLLARRVFFMLYLKLFKKPFFTANEHYVFDHFDSIKYYWDDIDELVGDGDLFLVQLNDPANTMAKSKFRF